MTPPYRNLSEPKKFKALLVGDHPIALQGLAHQIDREPGLSVCGHVPHGHEALIAIAALRPDVVILDVSLNRPGGLDGLELIRLTHARLPVLVLSTHDEPIDAATESVLGAIRIIRRGRCVNGSPRVKADLKLVKADLKLVSCDRKR